MAKKREKQQETKEREQETKEREQVIDSPLGDAFDCDKYFALPVTLMPVLDFLGFPAAEQKLFAYMFSFAPEAGDGAERLQWIKMDLAARWLGTSRGAIQKILRKWEQLELISEYHRGYMVAWDQGKCTRWNVDSFIAMLAEVRRVIFYANGKLRPLVPTKGLSFAESLEHQVHVNCAEFLRENGFFGAYQKAAKAAKVLVMTPARAFEAGAAWPGFFVDDACDVEALAEHMVEEQAKRHPLRAVG